MSHGFRVLGPLEVLHDGVPVPVPAGRVRVVLAALLLRAGEVVSADALVERLWDGSPPNPDRARGTLQMVVTRLRQALGEANVVRTVRGGYLGDVAPGALDLHVFRDLVEDGRFAEALALWRGEPLSDVSSDTLHAEDVAPLEQERLAVLERRIAADLAAGRAGELVAELRSLVRAHPLRERFRAQLMLALYRSGRQAEALAAYREARAESVAELGVEPGPELRELHEHILAASPDLTPPKALAVPRMLPATSPHFVGRAAELAELTRASAEGRIVVISGTAGVGKTTLAVHWANQVADRFPDGRLHVNLRGFDPSGEPVSPAEAVRTFLDAFEVPPQKVPTSAEGQLALLRETLAERRVLLVLDNARDADQVRPLLPAGAQCFAVVTSRHALPDLDARTLSLALLNPADARALLARRLGTERLADGADDLVERCAGLPLALSIVAARAAVHPQFSLRDIADQLAVAADRLDYLDAGEPDVSMRDVFSWSYRHLSPAAARLFRLLGCHKGVTVSVPAAAALAGVREPAAVASVAELSQAHLLFEHRPGWYSTYDLLRWYAAELAATDDTDAAAHRVLNWYAHTAFRARRHVNRDQNTINLGRIDGVEPQEFSSFEEACDWYEAERRNLALLAREAFDRGWWQYLPPISSHTWNFNNMRSRWPDILEFATMALTAAGELGELLAETNARINLGAVLGRLGRFAECVEHLTRALELSERIGDHRTTRISLNNLGMAKSALGRTDEALGHLRRALEICHATEGRPGEPILLDTLATIHRTAGNHDHAVECLERALHLNVTASDRYSAGINLANLARLHREAGHLTEAAGAFEQSLDHSRAVGDRHNEALALAGLGDVRLETGDLRTARDCWRGALEIFKDLGAPETREIGERLLTHVRAS
ncbi:BTAD domain-containing putative transcriptional regulator [Actinosynnema sp. CA-248983]